MNNNSSHHNGSSESLDSEIQNRESATDPRVNNPNHELQSENPRPETHIVANVVGQSTVPPTSGPTINPSINAAAEPVAADGKPATCNLQPSTRSLKVRARRRNGHIARLPRPVRDRINQLLDDGLSYPKIIKALGDDAKGITPRCIMSWKNGGYKDYLRHLEMLDQCRARQFRVAPLLNRHHNIDTFQATQQIATAQICETMLEMGTDILRRAIVENPLNYFRMLNAVSRLTNGGLRCERHLLDEAAIKAERDVPAGERNKYGMTPQQMSEFRQLLNEM